MQKMGKRSKLHISTSIFGAQHPNAGQNIQHMGNSSALGKVISVLSKVWAQFWDGGSNFELLFS